MMQIILIVVSPNGDSCVKNNLELIDLQVYYAVSILRQHENKWTAMRWESQRAHFAWVFCHGYTL